VGAKLIEQRLEAGGKVEMFEQVPPAFFRQSLAEGLVLGEALERVGERLDFPRLDEQPRLLVDDRSGMPTRRVEMAGSPHAIASISICGSPSTSSSDAHTQGST